MQNINASIAEQLGGKYFTISYKDLVKPQKKETRTGDEIREGIKEKLRNIGAKDGRIDIKGGNDARQDCV